MLLVPFMLIDHCYIIYPEIFVIKLHLITHLISLHEFVCTNGSQSDVGCFVSFLV